MNRVAATERAIDLVKTALGAGWCNNEVGRNLGTEVADAIDVIVERLVVAGAGSGAG